MKNRPKDEVVAGLYVNSKDVIVLLTNKGVIKRFKTSEILKGHKNHVGKQYVTSSKSSNSHIIDAKIIHKTNIDQEYVNSYVVGSEAMMEIDLGLIKGVSKTPSNSIDIGKVEKLLIVRNDNDFNK